jgi:hypothetical protein
MIFFVVAGSIAAPAGILDFADIQDAGTVTMSKSNCAGRKLLCFVFIRLEAGTHDCGSCRVCK